MKESKGGRRRDRALLLPDTQHEPLSDKDSDMNFLTLPNQNLSSNILRGGFFAQADLPAPLAGAFVGFDDATDALINVALSSVFHTAPESDEFALDLDRDDFQIGDRFDIAVRVFDEDGNLQNFGSTDLTIFVDEFMNDGTILFGITTRELSHDRVNPSEVARLENEAVDAYLNGETDEVPACLVEEAPEAPAVETVPFGTCPICERSIRVLKNGSLARHGWKTHSIFRFQSSSCEGSQSLPLEVSRDALISHVARLSKFEDFGPKTISPRGLLKLISEKMETLRSWEPRELTLAPRVPEAPVVEKTPAPVVEKAPAPVVEKAPAPKVEREEFVRPSTQEIKEMIKSDSYVLGDEIDAPIAEMKTLKSGEARLKGETKLAVGDLVLLPAGRIACFSYVSEPQALVPTRVLRVTKRGLGLDFIYVGRPIVDGEPSEVVAEELSMYLGVFQEP